MTFVKGKSGNPKGRKKENAEVSALAAAEAPEAFKRIINLSKTSEDIKILFAANNAIVERACGKPTQAVEHSGEVELIGIVNVIKKEA